MAIFGDQKMAVIGAEVVLLEFSAIWLQVFFGILMIVFDEKVPKTPNLALHVPFVDFLVDLIGFDGISSTRFRGSFSPTKWPLSEPSFYCRNSRRFGFFFFSGCGLFHSVGRHVRKN